MGDPEDVDNHAAMTGPSYRETDPANRGTAPANRTRVAQATPKQQMPRSIVFQGSPTVADAAQALEHRLAQLRARIDLTKASTWPTSAEDFLDGVIDSPAGRLKLMHVSHATLTATPLGVTGTFPTVDEPMPRLKALRFLRRFVLPLPKYSRGVQLMISVINGRHSVGALWATERQRFGLTGTSASDTGGAGNRSKGSQSLIFMDEHGEDWKAVPDLDEMPDIGFFHELVHAEINQKGINDGIGERDVRVEENRYRHQRGASSQRDLTR